MFLTAFCHLIILQKTDLPMSTILTRLLSDLADFGSKSKRPLVIKSRNDMEVDSTYQRPPLIVIESRNVLLALVDFSIFF